MDNWKTYELGELLLYEQPSKYIVDSTNYDNSYAIPVLTAGKSFILGYTNEEDGIYPQEGLPVIIFDDFTTSSKYVDFSFKVKSSAVKILKPNTNLVLPKYIFYRMQIIQFEHSTHKRYWIQQYSKLKVTIPDIAEQKKVVEQIEEMLLQLDNGEKLLQKTKEQIVFYRQVVLKEVFKNIKEMQTIAKMSQVVTSGSRGWAKYYADEGARFIRITDLTRDKISIKDNNIQFVKLPEKVEGKRSRLKENDVLISITADLGSIALVPEDIEEAYINQHIAMIRFNNVAQGRFMAWYLKSDYGQKDLLKNRRGGGKLGLGLDDIKNTLVPVVDNTFAKKVVELIDSRMLICDKIEEIIMKVLKQTEALKQSILNIAFEGRIQS